MSIDPQIVYSGKALESLSHEPYSGCSFPLARMLEIKFNNGRYSKEDATVPSDIEANISAYASRISQMAPKPHMVKLL
ncbi:hypothetical protein GGI17_005879, partial [Coemansia sp. S146]